MAEASEEFVCTYRYDGHDWGVNIHAADWQDASARLRAIGTTGRVDGTIVMNIPLTPGTRFRTRLKAALAILIGAADR